MMNYNKILCSPVLQQDRHRVPQDVKVEAPSMTMASLGTKNLSLFANMPRILNLRALRNGPGSAAEGVTVALGVAMPSLPLGDSLIFG